MRLGQLAQAATTAATGTYPERLADRLAGQRQQDIEFKKAQTDIVHSRLEKGEIQYDEAEQRLNEIWGDHKGNKQMIADAMQNARGLHGLVQKFGHLLTPPPNPWGTGTQKFSPTTPVNRPNMGTAGTAGAAPTGAAPGTGSATAGGSDNGGGGLPTTSSYLKPPSSLFGSFQQPPTPYRMRQPGDLVTLNVNGQPQQHKVTAVHPNGTFDAEPVTTDSSNQADQAGM